MTTQRVDRIALYSRSLAKDGARRAELRRICSTPLIDYSHCSWGEWLSLGRVAAECAALTLPASINQEANP